MLVILDFSTLRGTSLPILNPKRYDKHPCHFYRGGIPPPLRDKILKKNQNILLKSFYPGGVLKYTCNSDRDVRMKTNCYTHKSPIGQNQTQEKSFFFFCINVNFFFYQDSFLHLCLFSLFIMHLPKTLCSLRSFFDSWKQM